jgi:NTP pyrophosphatase (non-canonical NTP hydrolase)
MTDATFAAELQALEERALEIQLTHFGIPPEERGRAFYAMETVGEMGELVNGCKKYIRTTLAHRRDTQSKSAIPEEAADTLIALMLVKLAAGDTRRATPEESETIAAGEIEWLHGCLSRLACRTSELYVEEALQLSGEAFDLARYEAIVGALLDVAGHFGFSLNDATHEKLTQIIGKVQNGYYD